MIESRPAYKAVNIDLTTTNFTVTNPLVSGLHAVAGSGLVQVTLRGGGGCVLYIRQGDVIRVDVASVVKAGTDAVFQSAAGDLVGLVDRTD